jgi:hypothetical protein
MESSEKFIFYKKISLIKFWKPKIETFIPIKKSENKNTTLVPENSNLIFF